MDTSKLENCTWEAVGFIELDTATIDFIDGGAALTLQDGGNPIHDHEHHDLLVGGFAGKTFNTGEDACYPVEVTTDVEGTTISVRVEYVTDIAELDGSWNDVGTLEIASGQLMIGDLLCFRTNPPVFVPVPGGRHTVQEYHCAGDRFGARLIVATR